MGGAGALAVSVPAVSLALSTIGRTPATIANNGTDTCYVTLTVRDAWNRPMPNIPAAACVLASTGTGNTITQPTAATNSDGQTTCSIVSTGIATKTLSFTVYNQAATATITVDVVADPGGPPSEWFQEAWDYTSTANMQANPNGWFEADSESHPTYTDIELDTGLTTPWGGTKALKITFNDMTGFGCDVEVTAGKNIKLPLGDIDQPREMWTEFYLKYTPTWKVSFSCGSYDHKTLFITQKRTPITELNYRWRFSVGNDPSADPPIVYNDPASGVTGWLSVPPNSTNEADYIGSDTELWDGNWHRCRLYMKLATAYGVADAKIKVWVNDVLVRDISTYQSAGDADGGARPMIQEYFQRFALSRNMNERPEQTQSIWFGRIMVYTTDPSW